MASVQERLQLKRVPLDKWSISEQLCLASAVACSGDQNWMSVSRSLKMMCGTNRPSDWFSQKSCAAQYGKLLENAETPKRKKRTDKDMASSWNTVETPSESILRRLTQERMAELTRLIQEEQLEYSRIKEETLVVKQTTDEAKLREMWQKITAEEKQREKESAQHAQWLKEREERKLELERAWRPATHHLYQTSSPNSPAQSPRPIAKSTSEDMEIEEIKTGTSPLLSSLLKSPSTSSTSQTTTTHLTTPVNATRVAAPTITNLLTGNKPTISVEIADTKETFPLMHQSLTCPPRELNQANQMPAQSPSQAAPTLSMLLENKTKETSVNKNLPRQQQTCTEFSEESTNKSSIGSPLKDEEQQLMEVFNTLIPDNIDVLDILDDNDAIILNPELLAEAEDSILESVESLLADQADLEMDTDDFQQSIANPVAIVAESMSTAELVEQLTSTSGFPIGPTSTVKGDANPEPIVDDQVIILDSVDDDPQTPNVDATKATDSVEVLSKDDDQSDLSNDAPLSELLKDKSNVSHKCETNPDEDDEPVAVASPKDRTDVFESDSNDDKCLEIIKREIHELTGLKENESSENSNEAVVKPDDQEDVVSIKDDDEDSKLITVIPVKDESMDEDESQDVKEEKVETEETAADSKVSVEVDDIQFDSTQVEETPKEKSRNMSTNSTDTETPFEDAQEELPAEVATKATEQSITIEDTDDESVIEMITDDKHSRVKRDYTRRKTEVEKRAEDNTTSNALPEDTTKSTLTSRMRQKERDRSESPYVDDTDADSTHSRSKRRYSSTPVLDSMPNSPASSIEDNREYRAWKKSIQLVLNRLSMHKYANFFLRLPNSEDQSYRDTILRPMDLQTLKRNVDSGLVRTTVEFQRDVMLMCSNAVMFNATDDQVQQSMVRQMEAEALQTIDTIMEAWRKEYEKPIISATSMPVGVASISSPVASVATAAMTASSTTSASSKQPVRGRKSHRVSAVNQQ